MRRFYYRILLPGAMHRAIFFEPVGLIKKKLLTANSRYNIKLHFN